MPIILYKNKNKQMKYYVLIIYFNVKFSRVNDKLFVLLIKKFYLWIKKKSRNYKIHSIYVKRIQY